MYLFIEPSQACLIFGDTKRILTKNIIYNSIRVRSPEDIITAGPQCLYMSLEELILVTSGKHLGRAV